MTNTTDTFDILYLDDEQINLDGFYYSFMDELRIHRSNTPEKEFQRNTIRKYLLIKKINQHI